MEIDAATVAIVTGGASGLGAASAARLAKAGAQVAIFDRDADQGATAAREIGARFFDVNVADHGSVLDAVSAVAERLGPPRVLVNCAGIALAAKTVSKGAPHDPEVFARTIGVNLIGTFHCASLVAAQMVAAAPLEPHAERGVVINTASVAAFEGQMGQIAYAASKGGVVGMTLPMARDLARDGVRVVSIAPGLFLTPMVAGLPEEVQASLGAQVPFPARLGDPDEYAMLVEQIVRNPMLNGETIRLDGAIRMTAR